MERIFVDDREFPVEQASLRGGEIMDLAGIPRSAGLVAIEEDGSQRTIGVEEVVELRADHRFKKPPRFKRG